MNKEFVQEVRYKLQKRVRRVNSADSSIYHVIIKQYWMFLNSQPIITGILELLKAKNKACEEQAQKIFDGNENLVGDSEQESAAIGYFVIKKCFESENSEIERSIAYNYNSGGRSDNIFDVFYDFFVEPLYEYIDEQLDDTGLILSIVLRYKEKCEWFFREDLIKLVEADTSRGEKKLSQHFYSYLHDQGIKFSIEPKSASGEPDLVSSQVGEDPILADAKIFDPSRSKGVAYISKGFHQIYSYTCDYNEKVGYLIIYKTCEDHLKFSFKEKYHSIPCLSYNNKLIFFVNVDICKYSDSASKRGTIQSRTITEEDLIKEIPEL